MMKVKTIATSQALAKAAKEAQKHTKKSEFLASVILYEWSGINNRCTSALIGAIIHHENGTQRELLIDVNTENATARD